MDPTDSADDTADVSKRLKLVSDRLATSVSADRLIASKAATAAASTAPTAQPSGGAGADPELPTADFGAVISQIKLLLLANPQENEKLENRKIMRTVKRKFENLLENQRNSVDEDKKLATMAIAEQIAIWVESVVKEAALLGSSSTLLSAPAEQEDADTRVYPAPRKKTDVYEVTSQDGFFLVRNLKHQEEEEWEAWVNNALKTAEEWSYWISATCADVVDKGEQLAVEEADRRLTMDEFKQWRKAVGEEGIARIRQARLVREGKDRWVGSVPVEARKEWGRADKEAAAPNFVGPACESDEDLRLLAEMKAQQAARQAEDEQTQ